MNKEKPLVRAHGRSGWEAEVTGHCLNDTERRQVTGTSGTETPTWTSIAAKAFGMSNDTQAGWRPARTLGHPARPGRTSKEERLV